MSSASQQERDRLENQVNGAQHHVASTPVAQWTLQWTPSERSSPEKYALDDDDLSQSTDDSVGSTKRKSSAREGRSSVEARASKFPKN